MITATGILSSSLRVKYYHKEKDALDERGSIINEDFSIFCIRKLRKLIDLTTELFATQSENTLLQRAVDSLVQTFGYDVAHFRMIAPDGCLYH